MLGTIIPLYDICTVQIHILSLNRHLLQIRFQHFVQVGPMIAPFIVDLKVYGAQVNGKSGYSMHSTVVLERLASITLHFELCLVDSVDHHSQNFLCCVRLARFWHS